MLHKPPLRIVYALSFTKIYKMHTCFIIGMNAFFMLSKNNNIITEKICQIQIVHKTKNWSTWLLHIGFPVVNGLLSEYIVPYIPKICTQTNKSNTWKAPTPCFWVT